MKHKEKHVELAKGFVWSVKQPKNILLTEYKDGVAQPERKITI